MTENDVLGLAPILDAVLRLYGIPVPRDDALALVTILLANGGDLAVSAAKKIYKGVEERLRACRSRLTSATQCWQRSQIHPLARSPT
jgi:hypothetical protein